MGVGCLGKWFLRVIAVVIGIVMVAPFIEPNIWVPWCRGSLRSLTEHYVSFLIWRALFLDPSFRWTSRALMQAHATAATLALQTPLVGALNLVLIGINFRRIANGAVVCSYREGAGRMAVWSGFLYGDNGLFLPGTGRSFWGGGDVPKDKGDIWQARLARVPADEYFCQRGRRWWRIFLVDIVLPIAFLAFLLGTTLTGAAKDVEHYPTTSGTGLVILYTGGVIQYWMVGLWACACLHRRREALVGDDRG
jgi:hypothetical protein